MSLKFFLDANGGSLAFMKELDNADWANSVYKADARTDAVGVTSLNVTNFRHAMLLINPSNSTSYGFTIYGKGGGQITSFLALDGGIYENQIGGILLGVDCFGYEEISIEFDTTDASATYAIEMAVIPYEEVS